MKAMIDYASDMGVHTVCIGMPHRGVCCLHLVSRLLGISCHASNDLCLAVPWCMIYDVCASQYL